MVIGASQSFQFFRGKTWFFGSKRALSQLKYWILHHLIRMIKLQLQSTELVVRKIQFYVNPASHNKTNMEIKARKSSNSEARK